MEFARKRAEDRGLRRTTETEMDTVRDGILANKRFLSLKNDKFPAGRTAHQALIDGDLVVRWCTHGARATGNTTIPAAFIREVYDQMARPNPPLVRSRGAKNYYTAGDGRRYGKWELDKWGMNGAKRELGLGAELVAVMGTRLEGALLEDSFQRWSKEHLPFGQCLDVFWGCGPYWMDEDVDKVTGALCECNVGALMGSTKSAKGWNAGGANVLKFDGPKGEVSAVVHRSGDHSKTRGYTPNPQPQE